MATILTRYPTGTVYSGVSAYPEEAVKARFFAVIEQLKDKGKITSDRDFARTIGSENPSLLGDIRRGKIEVSIKIIWLLKHHYPGADIDYILFG